MSSSPRSRGRQPQVRIKWTPYKRQVLAAARAVAASDWRIVCKLWTTHFPEDAADLTTVEVIDRLYAQWQESRKDSGPWKTVTQTEIGLEKEMPDVMKEFRDAVRGHSMPVIEIAGKSLDGNNPRTSLARINEVQTNAISDSLTATANAVIQAHARTNGRRSNGGQSQLQMLRSDLETPCRPVAASQVHLSPAPECSGRYYEDAASVMSRTGAAPHVTNLPRKFGFVSGKHSRSRAGVWNAPSRNDPNLWMDIEAHVNQRTSIESPLVSSSFNLTWLIRQALLKEAKGQAMRGSIFDTVDAAGGEMRRTFYLPPYHEQLREKKVFDADKHKYHGKYEILYASRISASAIMTDFSIADLKEACLHDTELRSLLNLDALSVTGYSNVVFKTLRRISLPLDHPTIIVGLAKLVAWLWLYRVHDFIDIQMLIRHVVGNLLWAYGFVPSAVFLSRASWRSLAVQFATTFASITENQADGITITIGKAFLFGVVSGLCDPTWVLHEALCKSVGRKARKWGLVNIDEVFAVAPNTEAMLLLGQMRALTTTTINQPPRPGRQSPAQQARRRPHVPRAPKSTGVSAANMRDDVSSTPDASITDLVTSRRKSGRTTRSTTRTGDFVQWMYVEPEILETVTGEDDGEICAEMEEGDNDGFEVIARQ